MPPPRFITLPPDNIKSGMASMEVNFYLQINLSVFCLVENVRSQVRPGHKKSNKMPKKNPSRLYLEDGMDYASYNVKIIFTVRESVFLS